MTENVYIVLMNVEDEMNFLIKCDFHLDLRYCLFQRARSIDESLMDMNDVGKFIFLMTGDNIKPLLGKTIHVIFYVCPFDYTAVAVSGKVGYP